MQAYRQEIRLNTPQEIIYTFKDQAGNVIPLDDYTQVFLQVKCQNKARKPDIAADFVTPKADGTVRHAGYAFTEIGVTMAQFYCVDGAGAELWGDPLNFRVAGNVEDAGLKDILEL